MKKKTKKSPTMYQVRLHQRGGTDLEVLWTPDKAEATKLYRQLSRVFEERLRIVVEFRTIGEKDKSVFSKGKGEILARTPRGSS